VRRLLATLAIAVVLAALYAVTAASASAQIIFPICPSPPHSTAACILTFGDD
jgi:hypothetical protein